MHYIDNITNKWKMWEMKVMDQYSVSCLPNMCVYYLYDVTKNQDLIK